MNLRGRFFCGMPRSSGAVARVLSQNTFGAPFRGDLAMFLRPKTVLRFQGRSTPFTNSSAAARFPRGMRSVDSAYPQWPLLQKGTLKLSVSSTGLGCHPHTHKPNPIQPPTPVPAYSHLHLQWHPHPRPTHIPPMPTPATYTPTTSPTPRPPTPPPNSSVSRKNRQSSM